jgi:asparagine synthase (glutamine-hydrolysing)
MCGIAGVVGKKLTEKTILNLKSTLNHRGPNYFGKYIDLKNIPVQLFHSRLSIIDLSSLANQPFISDCGRYILIFNGEIYNYETIRNILSKHGFVFKTNSDTEVLLYAFIKWGVDCMDKLQGMFAFAIWDNVEESLFISRDRFGEKPLYYYFENGVFGFASEIRSLILLRDDTPKLNKDLLPIFLKYQTIPFENTLVNNIFSLKPGFYLILKNGNLQTNCYWNLEKTYSNDKINISTDSFKQTLIESVENSLISDVPLGLFLSGGIDSSILTVIAKKYLQKNISTFTVCFDDNYFKDKIYASYVAKKYNTNHNEIFFNKKLIEENVFSALNDIDHPTADGINTWIVSKAVKDAGLTVALSGVGSDEIFGGYNTFRRMEFYRKYNKYAPKFLSNLNFNSSQVFNFITAETSSKAYSYNRIFFSDNWINKLLPKKSIPFDPYIENGLKFESNSNFNIFDFTSYMELSCYMSNVLLKDADQMSMAHSLEIRSPFLNHKVLEEFQKLNNNDKYHYNLPKGILHRLFKDDFSNSFWKRPKQGFIMPWKSWLTNELKPLSDKIFSKALEQQIFSESGIVELKKSFENNQISWSRYWLFLSLTNWIEKNNIY